MESLFKKALNFLRIELTVLFISALPIIELRWIIPVGISLRVSPVHVTAISFIEYHLFYLLLGLFLII